MRLTYSGSALFIVGTGLLWGPFVGAWFGTAPCSWQLVFMSAWLSSLFWFTGAAIPMVFASHDPTSPGLTNAVAAIWALVAVSASVNLPGVFGVPDFLVLRSAVVHCAGCG